MDGITPYRLFPWRSLHCMTYRRMWHEHVRGGGEAESDIHVCSPVLGKTDFTLLASVNRMDLVRQVWVDTRHAASRACPLPLNQTAADVSGPAFTRMDLVISTGCQRISACYPVTLPACHITSLPPCQPAIHHSQNFEVFKTAKVRNGALKAVRSQVPAT